MSKLAMALTKDPIISNAGLLGVGELLRISGIDDVCTHRESANHLVAEKTTCGAYASLSPLARPALTIICQHKDDAYFSEALGRVDISLA